MPQEMPQENMAIHIQVFIFELPLLIAQKRLIPTQYNPTINNIPMRQNATAVANKVGLILIILLLDTVYCGVRKVLCLLALRDG